MKYVYYPGCSLEGTAREYDIATRGVLSALEVEWIELSDWSCCGASAAEAQSRLLALALPARNLALAAAISPGTPLLVPCSACYLNLRHVTEKIRSDDALLDTLNEILATEDLRLTGDVEVRHLLEVLSRDIGAERIGRHITQPLPSLTVAPYYGCQALRPYVVFDDPERPASMAPLIAATGARPLSWEMGARCCGGANLNTKPQETIGLVRRLLEAARPADAVVTVCPMCQMNLEAHQRAAARPDGADLTMAVLYLPQLLGIAMGLDAGQVRLDLNLSLSDRFRRKLPRAIAA